MPAFEDDLGNFEEARPPARRGGGRGERYNKGEGWDVEDDGLDDRDLVPDEMTTVRCTHCRKYIFEDSIRCPYCKDLQLESDRGHKPFWFVATVIFCIGVMGGFSVLYLFGFWPWR